MLKISVIENLIKKYDVKIQDTDNFINKFYSIRNQVLFTNNGNDKKISSLLKFLQSHFNYLNDNFKCDKATVSNDKIIDTYNNLKSKTIDCEALIPTSISCEYNGDTYTILKTENKKLLMVNSEYLNMFKDVFYSVNKERNTNIINIVSQYDMEVQGIIISYEFLNIDDKRVEINDYINSLL